MQSPRPLLLTANDTGGAGIATRRIHEGLREINVDSKMLVRNKGTDDPTIQAPTTKFSKALSRIRPQLDSLPLRLYDASEEYSINWVPDRLHKRVEKINPDIVHLNWVGGGYMSAGSIDSFNRPVVWRLADMWPLTGGCHYADGCTRYRSSCGKCPQLNSSLSADPSRITLKRKKQAVEQANVTVVATTSWLAESARESSIFKNCPVEVIPNGLNTDIFKSFDQSIGRGIFGLPSDVPLVLFGAVGPLSNPRKGHDLLVDALRTLQRDINNEPELVVFGTNEPEKPSDFGFETHYIGYLNDEESLALLYSAVDVMIVPSRYEGFGQTVTEAMACGTPVVAFDTTGPGEIIDHKETGYLASAYDTKDLANGIKFLVANPEQRSQLGKQARNKVLEQYQYTRVAGEYLDLYERIIE